MIHQDDTATFYVGKTDCGQGTGTAFRQIMSDELDFPYDKTTCIMGSTDITVDQGGSGGSTAMERDSWPMRRVAAEARRVLLEMASTKLNVPVERLSVCRRWRDYGSGRSSQKRVTYGQLIGGKRFNVAVTGKNINVITGVAAVKPVQALKNVGQSPKRYDIPAKVDGSLKWAVDVRLPGMVHARNVKPPFAGAKLISIDESSVRDMPGFVKVVSKGNYVAVVCEREEQAINAGKTCSVRIGKSRPPRLSRHRKTCSNTCAVQRPHLLLTRLWWETRTRRSRARRRLSKPITRFRIKDTPRSAWPTHLADPLEWPDDDLYSNDMKSYGMRTGVATFTWGCPGTKCAASGSRRPLRVRAHGRR